MRILTRSTLCFVLVACSSSTPVIPTSTTPTTSTTVPAATTTTPPVTTTKPDATPPLLAGHEIRDVRVGDRVLRLAIADTPGLRATGLMGVTDLGNLDGMLFYWRHTPDDGFWMKDTVIPLDIAWFDMDGSFIGLASMVPCDKDPCISYSPGDGIDYRYAIEADPGDLDWIDEDTMILYTD
ncbi:MAG: DUF192 domain-containing protein [Acidimicrobiia bacterium]